MREQVRCQLLIVAAASVIFFTNLGRPALWDMDEALYASCAREMLQRGDWVVPWFNGQMFPEKPPLMFWTMMAGFELFGTGEWGARFFSAVMGVGTALAAFHLGRLLFNVRVGFWTGLITASTIVFTISARAATVDSALTLLTTLAFLLFVIAGGRRLGTRDSGLGTAEFSEPRTPSPEPRTPNLKLLYAVLMYACIGATVLAKGPVGMLLPLAAMGLYLLVVNGWRKLFWSVRSMRPFTAVLVVAAVALPWYVWVGIRTDGEWLRVFFLEFNLRPFQQPIQGHGDTGSLARALAVLVSVLYYFYHVPGILFGFFPWSVFLGPTLVDAVRGIRGGKGKDGLVLASCWFGVWFVFWSICKTKLPHYLLPAYPALALLTACFIDRWLTEKNMASFMDRWLAEKKTTWWLRNAWISTILTGAAIMIAIPIVAAVYLPGEAWLGLMGLILVLGGGLCWRLTAGGRHRQAAAAFAVMAVVFLTAVFGFAVLGVDRHQNAEPMIAAIRTDSPRSTAPPIATYRFFRESTVFYAGHPVTKCDNDQRAGRSAQKELARFLADSKRSYVITTDKYEAEIIKTFPSGFQKIFHQRRFLGPGEMVVLRWAATQSVADGAFPRRTVGTKKK